MKDHHLHCYFVISVFQFQYGEDGLEIQKTQFINEKQFPFLIGNKDVFTASGNLEDIQKTINVKKAPKMWKKVSMRKGLYNE